MSTYYLAHHGVKGMKWGIRRYQNPDGSLKSSNKNIGLEDALNKEKKKKKLTTGQKAAIVVGITAGIVSIIGGVKYAQMKKYADAGKKYDNLTKEFNENASETDATDVSEMTTKEFTDYCYAKLDRAKDIVLKQAEMINDEATFEKLMIDAQYRIGTDLGSKIYRKVYGVDNNPTL